jgi:hypothetical protein
MQCERCGESYSRRDTGATKDFCGTCTFINGPTPSDNLLHKKTAQSSKIVEPKEETTEVD